MDKLAETGTLLAFRHPQPAYPVHILLVPKRTRATLADLSADDADFLVDLLETTQALVTRFGLARQGYRLIVNGGPFQEVAQVHFHLVSESQGPPVEVSGSP